MLVKIKAALVGTDFRADAGDEIEVTDEAGKRLIAAGAAVAVDAAGKGKGGKKKADEGGGE